MKAAVIRLLRRVTYWLGYQNLDHLSLLLNSRMARTGHMFIVQIGANDGSTYDPIHQFIVAHPKTVSAVLLEPVAAYHEQLRQTYAAYPGVVTLQKAIHRTERRMVVHRVNDKHLVALPSFTKGIASFDPEYHKKSKTPSEFMVSEEVECLTFDELLRLQGIELIDLLCIDTEGYDAEIVRSIDFTRLQPAIITFEHGLRDEVMSDEAFSEVVRLLNANGYDVMVKDYDVIAHRRDRLAH